MITDVLNIIRDLVNHIGDYLDVDFMRYETQDEKGFKLDVNLHKCNKPVKVYQKVSYKPKLLIKCK